MLLVPKTDNLVDETTALPRLRTGGAAG